MAVSDPQTDTRVLGRVASVTVDHYLRSIVDSAFPDFGTWGALMRAGVKEMHRGGERVHSPINLASPDKAEAFDGTDIIDTTPGDTRTAALHTIRNYASAVTLLKTQMMSARSPEAFTELVRPETDVALADLMNRLNRDLWLDGTGAGGKRIEGFADMIAVAPGTGTYGGVSRLNNANWRNQFLDESTAASLLAGYRQVMSDCTSGGDKPNLIIGGRRERDNLEAAMTTTVEIDPIVVARGGAGDASIDTLRFRTAAVVTDEDRQTYGGGTGLVSVFLNTKYLKLRVRTGADMEMSGDFVEPANQAIMTGKILWMGAFLSTQLRRQGVLFNQ